MHHQLIKTTIASNGFRLLAEGSSQKETIRVSTEDNSDDMKKSDGSHRAELIHSLRDVGLGHVMKEAHSSEDLHGELDK